MRIAILFPGQGTQAPGMGIAWKGHRAWSVVAAAEQAIGAALAPLLLDASSDDLAATRNAQLAVLLTSLIAWEALQVELGDSEHEIVGFAGHSLGQVTALIAARTLALDDGVKFAAVRAGATQREASQHPGRMVAFVGATLEQAETACARAGDAWVANDNAPGQVVVAGTHEGVASAIEHGKALGIRKALALAVGGAFHTPLMQGAVQTLDDSLAAVRFQDSGYCVVSNADAQPYCDGSGWRDRLATHPTQRVLWRASMETLTRDLHADALLEVGYGTMIAGVAKRTVPGTPLFSISTPATADAALASLDTHQTQLREGTR